MKTTASIMLVLLMSVTWGLAQQNGQPASDSLFAFDMWGNPTFMGSVSGGGPTAHSVW